MGSAHEEKFRQQWAKIIARCWNDEQFKERLIKNPNKTLADEGIDIPLGIKIHIHENSESNFNIVIPINTSHSLSEEELKAYAGGACLCFICKS